MIKPFDPTNPGPIHPRLLRRQKRLAQLLGLDDTTELVAALADIQTLLHRCGYHLSFSIEERVRHLRKRRRSKRAGVTTGRGRPAGSANWASRQLGLGLATIWADQTGHRPTRRFDPVNDVEYGPYREFVACVLSALPERLRATRKGRVPEVDHLVRVSGAEWKDAQRSEDEARRRGLLAESQWMGSTVDEAEAVRK